MGCSWTDLLKGGSCGWCRAVLVVFVSDSVKVPDSAAPQRGLQMILTRLLGGRPHAVAPGSRSLLSYSGWCRPPCSLRSHALWLGPATLVP